jgi:putative membrane protein
MRFVAHVVSTAFAVWVSTALPGIDVGGDSLAETIGTLAAVALLFGAVNAVIKPVVKVLGCAFYILTLGLFALVVNGLLFWFASWLADRLGLAFTVDGFWSAVWGALIVGVVSFVLDLFLAPRERPAQAEHRRD